MGCLSGVSRFSGRGDFPIQFDEVVNGPLHGSHEMGPPCFSVRVAFSRVANKMAVPSIKVEFVTDNAQDLAKLRLFQGGVFPLGRARWSLPCGPMFPASP